MNTTFWEIIEDMFAFFFSEELLNDIVVKYLLKIFQFGWGCFWLYIIMIKPFLYILSWVGKRLK